MKIEHDTVRVTEVTYDASAWGFLYDTENRDKWADLLNRTLESNVNKFNSTFKSVRAELDKVYDLIEANQPDDDISDVKQFGIELLSRIYGRSEW